MASTASNTPYSSSASTMESRSAQHSPAPSFSSAQSQQPPPSISTPPPTAPVSDKADDSSKLKTFLSILRKFIGVADIAAVRFSLPSQLMEPIPNLGLRLQPRSETALTEILEYWQYLDRPETFISIGKSDDEVGRMLEVLRFWFTKDLVWRDLKVVDLDSRLTLIQKYVKGKPCKPYNSTLGEFFRCNWEIKDDVPPIDTPSKAPKQPPADPINPALDSTTAIDHPVRISFLTEQTSHHPPVSAYWYECKERGISARGIDQLSAKFTGTSIRVTPGHFNLGIFVTLHNRGDEEYQMTHPAANLGGLLRGSLGISVADVCSITCPKTKIKALLHYLDEGWIGSSKNIVQGVIYRYEPNEDNITRLKDIPEKDILARVEGCWKEQVYYTIPSTPAVKKEPNATPTDKKQLLIDLVPLMPVPKTYPPEDEQLPNESRRYWREVTSALLNKQYAEATKEKQLIEERQREKAAERKARNEVWQPRFFTETVGPKGRPILTQEGKDALQGMQELKFHLAESEVTAS